MPKIRRYSAAFAGASPSFGTICSFFATVTAASRCALVRGTNSCMPMAAHFASASVALRSAPPNLTYV
jgi:hypothetical protein